MAPRQSDPAHHWDPSDHAYTAPTLSQTDDSDNNDPNTTESHPSAHQSSTTTSKKASSKKAKIADEDDAFNSFVLLLQDDEDAARRVFGDNHALRELIVGMRSEVIKLRSLLDHVLANVNTPAKCDGCMPAQAPYPESIPEPKDEELRKNTYFYRTMWTEEKKKITDDKGKTKSATPNKKKPNYETSAKGHATYGWATDENGVHHNMATIEEATAVTRAALITLEDNKMLGDTFTLGSGVQAKVWIVTLLETFFPWLRHCHGHWKALELAQVVSHNFLKDLRGQNSDDNDTGTPTFPTSALPSGTATLVYGLATPAENPATLKRKLKDLDCNVQPTPPPTTEPKRSRPSTSGKKPKYSVAFAVADPLDIGDAPSGLFATPAPPHATQPSWETPTHPMAPPSWVPNAPQANHNPVHDPALFADNADSDSSDNEDDNDEDEDDNNRGLFSSAPSFPPPTFDNLPTVPSNLPTSNWNHAPAAPAPPAMHWTPNAPAWPPPPPPPSQPPMMGPSMAWHDVTEPKRSCGRPPADPGKPYAFEDWVHNTNPQGDKAQLKRDFDKIWKKVGAEKVKIWNDHAAAISGKNPAKGKGARNTAALQLAPPPSTVYNPTPSTAYNPPAPPSAYVPPTPPSNYHAVAGPSNYNTTVGPLNTAAPRKKSRKGRGV
ncbi:hypothetical protein FA13DRAFT_1805839 [Coprinellus micaceus]|uniref:Uncharacterized protein n=1 Tax=Coprinellus micaceus TaxID=71717 RepID=A0A4Y7RWN1_COPMI|nr:hypothetical protein FA13DRAFT_1805839 [Coprinellus micaceus]